MNSREYAVLATVQLQGANLSTAAAHTGTLQYFDESHHLHGTMEKIFWHRTMTPPLCLRVSRYSTFQMSPDQVNSHTNLPIPGPC